MTESYWTFSKTEKDGDGYKPTEVMRFFPDENGLIDVKIAEGFTLTDAAKTVVEAIRNVQRN